MAHSRASHQKESFSYWWRLAVDLLFHRVWEGKTGKQQTGRGFLHQVHKWLVLTPLTELYHHFSWTPLMFTPPTRPPGCRPPEKKTLSRWWTVQNNQPDQGIQTVLNGLSHQKNHKLLCKNRNSLCRCAKRCSFHSVIPQWSATFDDIGRYAIWQ